MSLVVLLQAPLGATQASAQPIDPPPQSAPADQARLAEALFDEGKEAMDRGDYASACAKFEESRRLDPAGGTQLALGVCYERAGKLASAWNAYREAFAAAQRDARSDREEIAEQRLSALEPRLSRVTIVVPPEVAGLPKLRVELGALELRPPSWGLAVPFDSGSYTLRVSAQGYVPWTEEVVLGAEGDHQRVAVPLLMPEPPDLTLRRRENRASGGPAPTSAPRNDPGAVERRLGLVFAGAAALALIPGVYFGGRAIAAGENIADGCRGDVCPEDAAADHEDALTDARRANVFIGAGLIAAGVSAYFFLTAEPSSPRRESRIGIGRNALKVSF